MATKKANELMAMLLHLFGLPPWAAVFTVVRPWAPDDGMWLFAEAMLQGDPSKSLLWQDAAGFHLY